MSPAHIAIIMDGNGRWAQARRRPRIWGHVRGSSRVRPIVEECVNRGVKYLTLFAFSSENWGRPSDEVGALMRILYKFLLKEKRTLMANNIRLNTIGDTSKLPDIARNTLMETIRETSSNTGLTLTFALSYGSRAEIVSATKNIINAVQSGKLDADKINESVFGKFLWTADLPDPDIIIRTSGEKRISNFMLWQIAYSEFFFTEKMWPDFMPEDLAEILDQFGSRKRRFGLTGAQMEEIQPGGRA